MVRRPAARDRGARRALAPVADWLRRPAVAAARRGGQRVAGRGRPTGPARRSPAGAGAESRGQGRRLAAAPFLRRARARALAVRRPMLRRARRRCSGATRRHWRFLAFLVGLGSRQPLLVAATARRTSPTRTRRRVSSLARALRGSNRLTEVPLGPLGERTPGRRRHDAGRPLTDDDASRCSRRPAATRCYVVEAVRATWTSLAAGDRPRRSSGGPPARLAEPPMRRARSRAAAAVGRDFSLDLLAEASDLEAGRRRETRWTSCGAAASCGSRARVRLHARSPPRHRLSQVRPATTLAAAPAARAGARAAHARRIGRHRRHRSPTSTPRGGRPDRALDHYRRPGARPAVFAQRRGGARCYERAGDADRRLHRARSGPEGARGAQAMAEPLNAGEGYASPDLQTRRRARGRPRRAARRRRDVLRSLGSLWGSRFVQGRTTDAYEVALRGRQLAGSDPSERPRPTVRRRRHPDQPRPAGARGRVADAGRRAERRRDLAPDRHPPRRPRPAPGPRTVTGCSATRGARRATRRSSPSCSPAPSTTRTAWPWRSPTARSPTSCSGRPTACWPARRRWTSCRAGTVSATTESGPVIVTGSAEGGRAAHRPGDRALRDSDVLRPHAVLAVAAAPMHDPGGPATRRERDARRRAVATAGRTMTSGGCRRSCDSARGWSRARLARPAAGGAAPGPRARQLRPGRTLRPATWPRSTHRPARAAFARRPPAAQRRERCANAALPSVRRHRRFVRPRVCPPSVPAPRARDRGSMTTTEARTVPFADLAATLAGR